MPVYLEDSQLGLRQFDAPFDRIQGPDANGSIICNADGSITLPPLLGKNITLGGASTLLLGTVVNGLTAFAGGGQASATALTAGINRVTTVASAGDSVKLPTSAAGMAVTVINQGANPLQAFGTGTDTINGIAAATGIAQ